MGSIFKLAYQAELDSIACEKITEQHKTENGENSEKHRASSYFLGTNRGRRDALIYVIQEVLGLKEEYELYRLKRILLDKNGVQE